MRLYVNDQTFLKLINVFRDINGEKAQKVGWE